jgi:ectoine hydroxylase-related dioxygenase (phytanoyl-CoA dioxygenase family)
VLSRTEVREFFDVGYVVRPGLFDHAEVAELRAAFERLTHLAAGLGETGLHQGSQFVLERPQGALRIHRVVWCGAAEPVLAAYGSDPRLLRLAAQLLGSTSMVQLINQAHFKLPGDGVEFPWHQDSQHRRFGTAEWRDVNGRGSFVQIVTAIDDMTLDNGPLDFIPGSSRLGHVEPAPGAESPLPPALEDAPVVRLTLEAGGVVLFGPYAFHRSLANTSDRPRRAFVNGFASVGANSRVYPGCGKGQLVQLDAPPARTRH